MTDLEIRLAEELASAADGVQFARALPPELARRVARRRTVRLAALSTASTLAVFAVVVVSTWYIRGAESGRPDPDPLADAARPAVSALPPAPLSPRAGAASAWTGREFVVWGGVRGDQTASPVFANGAAFDPAAGSWRLLPEAPITGRTGAVAAWTGSELLVWGGNDFAPGPTTPADGALFNPITRTWRRIADAPAGRVFPRSFVIAGRVAIVGGNTPTGSPTSALVYDVAADRWHEIPFAANVADAAATPTEIIALSFDPATNRVAAAALDPVRATTRNLPALITGSRPQRLGIAWAGQEIVAAITAGGATRIAALEGSDAWRVTSLPSAAEFRPPVHIGFDPDTTPLVWTGSALLSASELGIDLLDMRTGVVSTSVVRDKASTRCRAGAAEAWSGTSLFSWGGQFCRAGDATETATGYAVTP